MHYEKLLTNDNATMDDYANLLLTDPITSASILRRANSAMYSKNRTINTLTMAITVLGIRTITELLYQSIVEQITDVATLTKPEMIEFWENSLTISFLAKEIGQYIGVNDIEELFISGLLCQIGCLPILSLSPESYYMNHKSNNTFPWTRQQSITGFTVNELSYGLLDSWGIPPRITLPINHAHDGNVELNIHANILHAAWLLKLSYINPKAFSEDEIFSSSIFKKLKLSPSILKVLIASGVEDAEKSLPTFI